MEAQICVLGGDGAGPAVVEQSVRMLEALSGRYGMTFGFERCSIGGCAIDDIGKPLPDETLIAASKSDAVLIGMVGGTRWDTTDPDKPRARQGVVDLMRALGAFCDLRPVHIFPALIDAASLKPSFMEDVDLIIVKEGSAGLGMGAHGREGGIAGAAADGGEGICAFDALDYAEGEIERTVRIAFELARTRGHVLHSVDSTDTLETSRLWREVVHRVAQAYTDVELVDMPVLEAVSGLISYPEQFDVIVAENTMADHLSAEASALAGSAGMMASASLGPACSLYGPFDMGQPAGGVDNACPLGAIMACGMMMNYSFALPQAEADILRAVNMALMEGWRTPDIAGEDTPSEMIVTAAGMGDKVVEWL